MIKVNIRFLPVLIFSAALLAPQVSYGDVKILLKNGRSVKADSCRETESEYVCSRDDGTFVIEKSHISLVMEKDSSRRVETAIPGENKSIPENTAEDIPSDRNTEVASEAAPEEPARGADLIKGEHTEEEARLQEIIKRKTALIKERESISSAQQRLNNEAAKTGTERTAEEAEEFNRKVSELEERILNFNKEVKALDEEEKKLLDIINQHQ